MHFSNDKPIGWFDVFGHENQFDFGFFSCVAVSIALSFLVCVRARIHKFHLFNDLFFFTLVRFRFLIFCITCAKNGLSIWHSKVFHIEIF